MEFSVLFEHERQQLILFYSSKEQLNEDAYEDFLKTNLPEHAIPDIKIRLNDFPITGNGKVSSSSLATYIYIQIDRKKLTEMFTAWEYEASSQETVVALISDALGENFDQRGYYLAHGGTSINAMRIIHRLCPQSSVDEQQRYIIRFHRFVQPKSAGF